MEHNGILLWFFIFRYFIIVPVYKTLQSVGTSLWVEITGFRNYF